MPRHEKKEPPDKGISALIDRLIEIRDRHGNLDVILEGCDCVGNWSGIVDVEQPEWAANSIVIKREN